MKTIFNKQKRSVAGVLIALTALTTAPDRLPGGFRAGPASGGLGARTFPTKDAGSTHVLVYSNGDWTARFTRPVKWASLNKLQGYGNNEIVFTYSANYGISRKIGVVFEKGSLTDTVMFSQAGAITDASLVLETGGYAAEVPVADLHADQHQPALLHRRSGSQRHLLRQRRPAQRSRHRPDPRRRGRRGRRRRRRRRTQAQPVEPWISNVSATCKGITFEVTDNDSGFARIADLTLFIEDAKGEITKSVLTVTQGIALPALSWTAMPKRTKLLRPDCAVPATTNNPCPTPTRSVTTWRTTFPSRRAPSGILKPAITDDGLTFSLAKNEGFEAAHRHDPAQPHRRTRQPCFGLVQNHPEALPDRCRFRRGARLPGRDHAPAVYRRLHRQRPPTARTSFRVPRPNSSSSTAAKRPDGLYREPSTASGASA